MITQRHYIHRVLLHFNMFSLIGVLGGTCPFFVPAAQVDLPPQRHFTFDLPAQPLSQALVIYGEITGLSILVRGNLTAGRQSSPVRGELTADEALRALLAGTRLTAVYTSGSAFTLQPQNRNSLE
ncbi:STN domain-containing protein, partial [Serratia marcescens]|uniref:STN domain-containing protein n=2 Tax=Gammaproteobacteria TaxID=1236 RepID=UPI003F427A75